jgi:uncharacterized protein YceH (UPF0502 family)
MEPLTPDECRVLGVLIEKQMTTPDQYPLTLNAIVAGSNQKNNRSPVLEMSDDAAEAAADGLRAKGLVVRVEQSGARVVKFRHAAAEKLDCRPAELALLAELLLRGPQTVGELRGRASRMQAFESLPAAEGFLRSLMERPVPLVRRLPPVPGSRAERYADLLSPDAHPLDPAAGVDDDVACGDLRRPGSRRRRGRPGGGPWRPRWRGLREALRALARSVGGRRPVRGNRNRDRDRGDDDGLSETGRTRFSRDRRCRAGSSVGRGRFLPYVDPRTLGHFPAHPGAATNSATGVPSSTCIRGSCRRATRRRPARPSRWPRPRTATRSRRRARG